jgi:hypothetical protein
MNDKETIKNRFINFEPEVDDFAIAQKWEKIKYFVPQKEKKRRGAIFFLYGTFALLLIPSLILTILYFPKRTLTGSEKENAVLQNTKTISNTKMTTSKNATTSFLAEKPSEKILTKQNVANSAEQKNTKSAFDTKKEVTTNSPLNTKEERSGFKEIKNISETDTVTYDQLFHLQFPILIPEQNNEITSSFTPNYYLPKPASRYSIDLLGGIQTSRTNIKQFEENQKNTSINYLAGIGINYHLRNKFMLTGQFVFSKNNFDHTYTVTENKITKQVLSISSSPTSAMADTTYYLHANTNYIIRSNESYHFAVGAEYNFLRKNKLSLSAFALFNVTSTKYTYGHTQDYSKDVYVYIKGSPNPPSANPVSSSFKEGDYLKKENRISTDLMPGILLSYRLNNKTSLIFKPAYLIDLSETKLIINSSAFTLKENSLLLNVGLRIHL